VIAVVDTGGANLASVTNAIGRLGREAVLTSDPARLRAASHVILPGVGAAADAMAKLEQTGLVPVVKSLTQPVLGICLGMQLFFARSTEGDVACLGLLPGSVTAITPDPGRGVTVPHMGWNGIRRQGAACRLLDGMADGEFFYFVHTYQAPHGPWVRAVTDHGGPVVAVVQHENFMGVQFHPERSGKAGAAMLERFFTL